MITSSNPSARDVAEGVARMSLRQVALIVACAAVTAHAAEPRPPSTSTTAEAEREVLELERVWIDAELNHDAATLQRILDDKFVATLGGTRLYAKEEFIQVLIEGDLDPSASHALSDESVVVDRDTAVVIGTDTEHGMDHGAPFTSVYRYTTTYVHRQGRWLAFAQHMVLVPP